MKLDTKGSKIGALCLLAAATLPSIGCDSHYGVKDGMASDRMPPVTRTQTREERLAQVVDLGNGVFVFPNSTTFPETLADFRASKPDLRVVSVSQGPQITSGVGGNTDTRSNSFVVVTELQ